MSQLRIEVPAKLLPLVQERKRYKSAEGGRGSGKSHSVARALLGMGAARPLRIACCREVQKSIDGSVKRLFDDLIREYGLQGLYRSERTRITSALGGEIVFHGLREHRADDVKSMEGIDIVWIEEAQRVSEHSWQVLTPTVRKDGSEIWATWNPELETDAVYQRTWKSPWVPESDMLRLKCNWRDNPWYNQVLESERLALRAINQDLYDHVWEGKLRTLAGLLFKRNWFRRFRPGDEPRRLVNVVSTDYATTAVDDPEVTAEPDFTELGAWGQDEHGHLWARDWWYGQVEPDGADGWVPALAGLCNRWQATRLFEEKGAIYRATKAAVDRALRARGVTALRTPMASIASKVERAMGFVTLASAGMVHIPEGDWGDRLVNQLCGFTGQDGRHDDAVDVCSILARGLALIGKPLVEPKAKPRKVVPFTEAHFMATEHDDRDDDRREYERV